jgi:ABC-type bacteriocin/lantibiotic exporter with double-glycine peptidase domain
MQIAIIILAVIGANYLSKTISECFTNNDYANTIIISIFFILVFVINALIKYLCFLISVKRIKLNYLILTSQVLSALKNKNANFFNKVNKNYIYILDHSINTIITYNVVEVSNFISAFLFTFILIIYIGFVAPIFISLCVFTSIILGSLGYIECKYKQKMLNRATNNGTNNSENCAQYIRHIENNYSPHAIKNLMNKFKHNYFEYITIFTHSSKFNGGINMVNELIEKLLLVVSIVISSYMLDKYFAYDIGKIILLITLIGMYFNNVRTIVNFISLHVEYKIMHEIFVNILNLGNKSQGKYEIKCVKNIFYKNKQINNGGYIYEDTNEFKNILTKYIDSENTLKINGINIKDIKNE